MMYNKVKLLNIKKLLIILNLKIIIINILLKKLKKPKINNT